MAGLMESERRAVFWRGESLRMAPVSVDGGRATCRIFRAAFHRPLGHKYRAAPSQVCLPPETRESDGFRSCGHHHIGLLHPPHIRCVVAPGKSREGCCARGLIGAAPTGRCDGPGAGPGRWVRLQHQSRPATQTRDSYAPCQSAGRSHHRWAVLVTAIARHTCARFLRLPGSRSCGRPDSHSQAP